MLKRASPVILAVALGACGAEGDGAARLLGTAERCDAAHHSCRVEAKEMAVGLKLGPEVQPLKTFPIEVQLTGKAEQVLVDFSMVGMDMGLNRYRLEFVNASWSGTAMLPVCTTGRADWLAEVIVVRDGERHVARFPFSTGG